VIAFDEQHGITFPTISGIQGGGTTICNTYGIGAFPTVILMAPDHSIIIQDLWPINNTENIISELEAHGIAQHACDGPSNTLLSISPQTQSVHTSEVFNTEVQIADVENLGSFEIELHYDPSLIQANVVELGDFLGSSGRQIFPLLNTIDNSNGIIEFAVSTLGPNPPGPDGNGGLLNIEWMATDNLPNDIMTQIDLERAQLTEPNGELIEHSWQNASIEISSCFTYDFDCDCDVDIVDITMATYTYASSVGDGIYNTIYDQDNDGDIDIVDITMLTYNYGWSCGKAF